MYIPSSLFIISLKGISKQAWYPHNERYKSLHKVLATKNKTSWIILSMSARNKNKGVLNEVAM